MMTRDLFTVANLVVSVD